jgi:hypothetical protein
LCQTICNRLFKEKLNKLVGHLKENYSVFLEDEDQEDKKTNELAKPEVTDDPKNPLKITPKFIHFKVHEIENLKF